MSSVISLSFREVDGSFPDVEWSAAHTQVVQKKQIGKMKVIVTFLSLCNMQQTNLFFFVVVFFVLFCFRETLLPPFKFYSFL